MFGDGDGETSEDLIDAADRALIAAKKAGKNRVQMGAARAAGRPADSSQVRAGRRERARR